VVLVVAWVHKLASWQEFLFHQVVRVNCGCHEREMRAIMAEQE